MSQSPNPLTQAMLPPEPPSRFKSYARTLKNILLGGAGYGALAGGGVALASTAALTHTFVSTGSQAAVGIANGIGNIPYVGGLITSGTAAAAAAYTWNNPSSAVDTATGVAVTTAKAVLGTSGNILGTFALPFTAIGAGVGVVGRGVAAIVRGEFGANYQKEVQAYELAMNNIKRQQQADMRLMTQTLPQQQRELGNQTAMFNNGLNNSLAFNGEIPGSIQNYVSNVVPGGPPLSPAVTPLPASMTQINGGGRGGVTG